MKHVQRNHQIACPNNHFREELMQLETQLLNGTAYPKKPFENVAAEEEVKSYEEEKKIEIVKALKARKELKVEGKARKFQGETKRKNEEQVEMIKSSF